MRAGTAIAVAIAVAGAMALIAVVARLQQARGQEHARAAVEAAITRSWTTATPEWRRRLVQDETQRLCSRYHDHPPEDVAKAIVERAKATIRYPPDGRLMGDWRKGERLAQSGYGGRFTDVPPRRESGGNCYACHQLAREELSFGTLGPSLLGYGKAHAYAEAAVKAVYDRLYNPQAVVACASMPRFGAGGFLSIDQIKDLVAYVMAPDSPVNK